MQISQNTVSWPSSWLSHKIKPSVDFVQNTSKICWDIDQNVPFKWVVASHFVSKKLTLVHEGLVPLHQEFTELLTKMCSFSQNIGLLPLILTVSKNYS